MSDVEIELKRQRHIAGMKDFIQFVRAQRNGKRFRRFDDVWPAVRLETLRGTRREAIECPSCAQHTLSFLVVELINCKHQVCLNCCQTQSIHAPTEEPSCPVCQAKVMKMKIGCKRARELLASTMLFA